MVGREACPAEGLNSEQVSGGWAWGWDANNEGVWCPRGLGVGRSQKGYGMGPPRAGQEVRGCEGHQKLMETMETGKIWLRALLGRGLQRNTGPGH